MMNSLRKTFFPLRPAAAGLALALLAAAGARAAGPSSAPSPAAISLTGAPVTPESAASPSPASAAAPLTAAEAALLGAWTEGLGASVRAQLASLPPEQAAALRARLGDTLVFRADHTLRIFPRCSQAAQFGRDAALGLPARWEILGGRTLRVTSDRSGQPVDRNTLFKVEGDELSFYESMAARPQLMGRYEGPLPPACPQ
jgi:hypothetical protein